MSSRSRRQLEEWLKTIEVSGNILDIGNSQLKINKRIKSLDGEIVGADLEQPHEGEKSEIVLDLNYPIEFI